MTALALRIGVAAPTLSPAVRGTLWGFLAVALWAAYLAYARLGTAGGLLPTDFAALRFGVAGVIMLPFLLHHGLGGVAPYRALVLASLAGLPFIWLGTFGYLYAPLAHGAVVQPAAVTLGSFALAWIVLGDRLRPLRIAGGAVLIAGLALVAGVGGAEGAWRGDLAFAAAGLLWAGFAVLLKRWRVGAVGATAIVSVASAAVILPLVALGPGFDRLLALPPRDLLTKAVVQGVGSGVVAVIAFGRAVTALGPARAALFPAMVPLAAVLIGIPITGEWPEAIQWVGLAVATAGLVMVSR